VDAASNDDFYKKNLSIYHAPHLSVRDIEETVKEYNPEVIVIDHAQLLKVEGQTRAQALEDAMYDIKGIATQYNVAVALGSQISRESEKGKIKTDFNPIFFKGSGGIEDCASVAGEIKLAKEENKDNDTWRVNFEISKNRFGRIGAIPYIFARKYSTFTELKREEICME
jgi:replicative DNA helicase